MVQRFHGKRMHHFNLNKNLSQSHSHDADQDALPDPICDWR
jgi:hypothetical protein